MRKNQNPRISVIPLPFSILTASAEIPKARKSRKARPRVGGYVSVSQKYREQRLALKSP